MSIEQNRKEERNVTFLFSRGKTIKEIKYHHFNICCLKNILDKLINILKEALVMLTEKNFNDVLFRTARICGNGNVRVLAIILKKS